MDETLLAYRTADKLRGVADFNLAFTRARSMRDMLVAYYHAYRMAQYIATTYGAKRMKRMLVAWGEKRTTAEVFKRALGVADLAAFDAAFEAWLDGVLAPLRRGFRLDAALVASEAETRTERAATKPRDLSAQVAAAVAWLGRGDLKQAGFYADRALKLDAKAARALMVRATVKLERGDGKGAVADLAAIRLQGLDGAELQRTLARATRVAGDVTASIGHLEASLALDPSQGALYHALVELLDGAGRQKDAYTWRVRAISVDQGNLGLVSGLLEGAEAHGATRADILRWGELGNHIAPFSADHHARFARELARLGERPGIGADARADVAHDLRVGVHRRQRLDVRFPPAIEQQPLGLQPPQSRLRFRAARAHETRRSYIFG
ncbi:MAG: hypothetical protein QF464_08365, partial [Myxococcota bacterium]|nr:hypothetical protein [Myxococcota bacterium]